MRLDFFRARNGSLGWCRVSHVSHLLGLVCLQQEIQGFGCKLHPYIPHPCQSRYLSFCWPRKTGVILAPISPRFDRASLGRFVRAFSEISMRKGRPALFSKQFLLIPSVPERFLYFLPGPRAYSTGREENEAGQKNSLDRNCSRSGVDNSDYNLCNERLARRLARARFDQSSHGRH